MKKVLCFGDSNTYGFIPGSGKRYDKNTRWTGILQTLCPEFEIIEAGANNRTAFYDNPAGVMFTGYKILPSYLEQKPDIIILSIGINDLQFAYNPTLEEFYKGISKLVDLAKSSGARIILTAPSVMTNDLLNGFFVSLFDKTSIEKSQNIGAIYKKIAQEKAYEFLDLNEIAKVSKLDGLHYEPEAHALIAQELKGVING